MPDNTDCVEVEYHKVSAFELPPKKLWCCVFFWACGVVITIMEWFSSQLFDIHLSISQILLTSAAAVLCCYIGESFRFKAVKKQTLEQFMREMNI